jgi:hypothetical protein
MSLSYPVRSVNLRVIALEEEEPVVSSTGVPMHRLEALIIQVQGKRDAQVRFDDGTTYEPMRVIHCTLFENHLRYGCATGHALRLFDAAQLSGVRRRFSAKYGQHFTNLYSLRLLPLANVLPGPEDTPWSYVRDHVPWNRTSLLGVDQPGVECSAEPTAVAPLTNMPELMAPGDPTGAEQALRLRSVHYAVPGTQGAAAGALYTLEVEVAQDGVAHRRLLLRVYPHHLVSNGLLRPQQRSTALRAHLDQVPLAMLLLPQRAAGGRIDYKLVFLHLELAPYVQRHAAVVPRSLAASVYAVQRSAMEAEGEAHPHEQTLARSYGDEAKQSGVGPLYNVCAFGVSAGEQETLLPCLDCGEMRVLTERPDEQEVQEHADDEARYADWLLFAMRPALSPLLQEEQEKENDGEQAPTSALVPHRQLGVKRVRQPPATPDAQKRSHELV